MHADTSLDCDAAARATGEALAAFYCGAETAMRDLPIYNPALNVAALGFRAADGAALGIVVTPWFMNLVRVPPHGEASLPPDTVVARTLPVGVLDFTIGVLDGIGPIESCSLVSPMHDFADQQQAESTALAALAVVLAPAAQAADGGSGDVDGQGTPAASSVSSLDRRRFLRGDLTERRP